MPNIFPLRFEKKKESRRRPPCKNGPPGEEKSSWPEKRCSNRIGLDFKLTFHLFDLVDQKHLVGKQYEGPLQTVRSAVHRMADEVVFQITGRGGFKIRRSPTRFARGRARRSSLPISTVQTSNSSPKTSPLTYRRPGLRMVKKSPSPLTSDGIRISTSSMWMGKIFNCSPATRG